MTPKEKAEELVLKYLRIDTKEWFHKGIAKQCALVAVDEILEECLQLKVEYWEQVQQEIENL
jgi:hypothetical protein